MSDSYVLDGWAILAFLQDEEPAATRVREVIESAQEGTMRLFASIINIGEVYYRIGKTRNQKEVNSVLKDLYLLPIEVISANDDISSRRGKIENRACAFLCRRICGNYRPTKGSGPTYRSP